MDLLLRLAENEAPCDDCLHDKRGAICTMNCSGKRLHRTNEVSRSDDYSRGWNDGMAEAGRNLAKQMATATTEIVDCPRCFTQCGWCSDYRHMHGPNGGLIKLPGTNKRCASLKNDDSPCPICAGTLKVRRMTIFGAVDASIAVQAG